MIELLLIPVSMALNFLRGRSYDKESALVWQKFYNGKVFMFESKVRKLVYKKWWNPYFNALTSKGLTSLYLGLSFNFLHFSESNIFDSGFWESKQFFYFLAVWLGTWLWATPSWGEYYPFLMKNEIIDNYKKCLREGGYVKWIAVLASKIISPYDIPHGWAMVAMSIRGLLISGGFSYIGLWEVGVIIGILQGPIYYSVKYFAKGDKRLPYAELIYGFAIGVGLVF